MKSEVSEEIHKILLQLEPLFFWHTFKRLHENNDYVFFKPQRTSVSRVPCFQPREYCSDCFVYFLLP